MVAAFEFFNSVPKEVCWDNPRTVATLIPQGRERRLHPRHAAWASHHVFDPRFRMPARGNEKPDAEGTVKAARRRFATPVPGVANLDELNTFFRNRGVAERERVARSLFGPVPIAARVAEEQAAAAPPPGDRFDPRVIHPAVVVDQDQTVAFDANRYRVPRPCAFPMVTLKGDVDTVVIGARGPIIATHARSRERHAVVLDPLPYRATPGRKPGALDGAPVFRDGTPPGCFADIRAALERQHGGGGAGARQFARIPQLLGEHPLTRVRDAVETRRRAELFSAEAVIRRTRVLAAIAMTSGASAPLDTAATPRIHVPPPDPNRFDLLWGRPGSPELSADDARGVDGDDTAPQRHVSVFRARAPAL